MSERLFYQKITNLYATVIYYDKNARLAKRTTANFAAVRKN